MRVVRGALMLATLAVQVAGASAAGPVIVTGPTGGGGPHVRLLDPATAQEVFGFLAFDPAFTGGVRVATADVNGDGIADIIVSAGPGGGPHVRVLDGAAAQRRELVELQGFLAYGAGFVGGVEGAAAGAPALPPPQLTDAAGRVVGRPLLGDPVTVLVWVDVGGRLFLVPAGPAGFRVGGSVAYLTGDCSGDPYVEVLPGASIPPAEPSYGVDLPGATVYVPDPAAAPTVITGSVTTRTGTGDCGPPAFQAALTVRRAVPLVNLHALYPPPFRFR
jgi:hypothetical protein